LTAADGTVPRMDQSSHVWVCAQAVELVRADHIISVYASEATSDDDKFDSGPLRGNHLSRSEVLVCAQVAGGGGSGSRRVILWNCAGSKALPLIAELLDLLAKAGTFPGDVGKPSYIFPSLPRSGGEPSWELAEQLPREWSHPAPPWRRGS
jgi:hypothetical protein